MADWLGRSGRGTRCLQWVRFLPPAVSNLTRVPTCSLPLQGEKRSSPAGGPQTELKGEGEEEAKKKDGGEEPSTCKEALVPSTPLHCRCMSAGSEASLPPWGLCSGTEPSRRERWRRKEVGRAEAAVQGRALG